MSVLGMTLLGSRGNTRAQLSSVLKLNHSDEAVKDAFRLQRCYSEVQGEIIYYE